MSILDPAVKQPELVPHVRLSFHHGVVIHHLTQAQHPGMRQVGAHVLRTEGAAVVLKIGTGHAGGHHKKYIGRHLLGILQQIVDARLPLNIGALMRVDDAGGGAAGQHLLDKAPRRHQ